MADIPIIETLTGIALDIQKEMKSIIKLNGAFASGRLYDSVKYKVYKDKTETYHMEFDYVYYGLWINYGRRPSNKMPPINDIREWCRLKGIPQDAAWPIAKKIQREGWTMRRPSAGRSGWIDFTQPFERDQAIVKEIMTEMGQKFADDFVEQTLRDVKYFDKSYRTKK